MVQIVPVVNNRLNSATERTCFLCAKPLTSLVYKTGKWHYLQCDECGITSLYPQPTAQELLRAYQAYLPVKANDIINWKTMTAPVVVQAGHVVERYKKTDGSRLLDIGCGYGFFLEQMARKGWAVEGIEISESGREYARQNLGLTIHEDPLEERGFRPNCFDTVTLFYVIEHVHDPVGMLQEVHRILKPGGMILLRWPHSTPVVKILGPLARKFDIYHTPYHLFDFNPGSMKSVLDKTGFREVKHMIGSFTLPSNRLERLVSILCGSLAEWLYRLSLGRLLFPGVSKTTIGFKYEENDSDYRR